MSMPDPSCHFSPLNRYGPEHRRDLAIMDETGGLDNFSLWGPSAQLDVKVGDIIHIPVRASPRSSAVLIAVHVLFIIGSSYCNCNDSFP